MSPHYEVIRQSLEVGETALEGLEHVNKQLAQGRFESAIVLYNDVIQGIDEITQSFKVLGRDIPFEPINELTDGLFEEISEIVSQFENADYTQAQITLKDRLLPSYKAWYKQLTNLLQPYILT